MAGIDKAAIVFSIAIALVGVGIAVVGSTVDNAPVVSKTIESTSDSVAEKAAAMAAEKEAAAMAAKAAMAAEKEAAAMAAKAAMAAEKEAAAMAAEKEAAAMAAEKEAAAMAAEKEAAAMAAEKEAAVTAATGPTTHAVDIPKGTSVPGCETSNACYTPADIKVKSGDTVKWINVDTAAHTVTGGSPADGPSGVFDSSLVMANAEYAFTFDKAGSYKYFCMVHPWMVGSVSVS